MSVLLIILHWVTQPVAIPFWGALSFVLTQLYNAWRDRSKDKAEARKLALTAQTDDRHQTREDFNAITEALRLELARVKDAQADTDKHLESAREETEKCEQRYFELATQYRELLKYCANLARQVRELESKVRDHVRHDNQK